MSTPIETHEFDVQTLGADCDQIAKLIPRGCEPVQARMGDYVRVLGDGDDEGVIIGMTRDMCIFRTPDGFHIAREWAAVMLAYVEADPTEID